MLLTVLPLMAHLSPIHSAPAHNTARWLTAAYALVIVYATLHPLEALRISESSPWAFLFKPWSRFGVTGFDVGINVAAYLPLGFGVAWLLGRRWTRLITVMFTMFITTGLSLCLESLQSYSVLRVASSLDVLSNSLGGALGAVLTIAFKGRFSIVSAALNHCLAPHRGALWAVVALWALAQLHPQGWAFMTAPLTQLLGQWVPQSLGGKPLLGQQLQSLETITTVVALTGLLSLVRLGIHVRVHPVARVGPLVGALALAMAWQASAYVMQYGPAQWSLLLSTGVMNAAVPVLMVVLVLALSPSPMAWVCCVAALALHTALAQVLPTHPYTTTSPMWQQGRFIHLYGLTAVVSACWPVLALVALMLQSRYVERRSAA